MIQLCQLFPDPFEKGVRKSWIFEIALLLRQNLIFGQLLGKRNIKVRTIDERNDNVEWDDRKNVMWNETNEIVRKTLMYS